MKIQNRSKYYWTTQNNSKCNESTSQEVKIDENFAVFLAFTTTHTKSIELVLFNVEIYDCKMKKKNIEKNQTETEPDVKLIIIKWNSKLPVTKKTNEIRSLKVFSVFRVRFFCSLHTERIKFTLKSKKEEKFPDRKVEKLLY